MRILFIGDVFGSIGRRVLAENLDRILDENRIDVCIANGENAAGGKGITRNILKKFHKYGVQIVTGGNHSKINLDIYDSSALVEHVLRPMNFSNENRGFGKTIYELEDGRKIGVINLMGRTYFKEDLNCPFRTGLGVAEKIRKETPIIIVDFHAEATSDKVCLAHYLDGKVSAVLGTHTHVQTADERILSSSTAFITDVGMTGPEDSAIGMKTETVLKRYIYQTHSRFEPATKGPMFNAVVVDVDDSTGKANSISRIFKRVLFSS